MTEAVELPHVLQRVQEDASAALAFFRTWKALSVASSDDGHRATMNDQRHVDFFITTMEGCFRLVFLSLGKVFDRDKRSASLKLLARKLTNCGHADLAREIADMLSEHGDMIEKIRLVREKSVAHCDLTATSKALDDASVTPDQVEELIEASRGLLNRIGERAGFPDTISDGERNERAVQNLIDTLHDNRFPRTKTLG